MNEFPAYGMAPVRQTAYTATRNYARFPAGLPENYEPAQYDPADPTTWTKAAAQQQTWRFDQGGEPEWAWDMARRFPTDQLDGSEDLCEVDLALCGRWPV